MPDLDNELATVRAETKAIIQPPDFEHVLRRNDRHTARRRSVLAFAAVILVLGILVPLLQTREVTPAGLNGNVIALDFADPEHGFALLTDCLATEVERPQCLWRLEATRDGATWLPRTVPPLTGGPDSDVQALGKDTVVITQGGVRWLSKDGARTWKSLPPGLASPVDSIPPGAEVFAGCTDWRLADCDKRQVLVTLPDSGAVAPLANQPPMEMSRATAQQIPAADGSWWVYSEDKVTLRMNLAVSRDNGRTWQLTYPTMSQSPLDDRNTEWSLVDGFTVVGGNGVLYGLAHGMPSTVPGRPFATFFGFYRSVDGGRSWELTHLPTVDRVFRAVSATPVVTSAGDIIVSTPDDPHQRVLISKDGGRSFQPAQQPELDWITWTRAGYLNTRSGPVPRHWLSADGITWRELGGG
ncbi:hypothetical protein DMH04_35530 [Kibdelosporangium aridum]|uniref:Exo-alpha-sialidase n=1 Tax=Kibdelosporangium aridum TaxID=2030 RepID=A0A428YZV2_KIBAR|nr:hypothetical protein [Kibdelosporangium aridum]RSM76964.1 hypothetical protein DMH04_35530 [Kibdelosporangium aridum]